MNLTEMRPFQIVIMAIFGLVALVGLFVFATYSPKGGTNPAGPVLIWGTLPNDAMEGAIESLRAADDNFASVSYKFVRPESFSTELANALAAGGGPDLIVLSHEQLVAEMPKLELIPDSSLPLRTYRDTYASVFDVFLTEGGTYGIPLVVDPLVLYYNRAALASAGVASPPATWEAVSGLVGSLTRKGEGASIVKATAPLGGYGNVSNARAIVSTLFMQAGSSLTEVRSDGIRSALAKTPSGTGAGNPVQSALTFYTQFADSVKTIYTWNTALPASKQMFLSGDLALYPGYASESRSIAAGNPNLDFDMAPMPQPAVASLKTVYGVAYAFAIPRVSDNQAGAFSTAMALSSADYMSFIADRATMAPARRSLLAAPPANLYAPVYYPQALIARGWLSPRPEVVDGIFAGMILNVTSGRTSTGEALNSANESLDAALR